jgi:chromosome segregation ATPase
MLKDILQGTLKLYQKLLPATSGDASMDALQADLLRNRGAVELEQRSRQLTELRPLITEREDLRRRRDQLPESATTERATITEKMDTLGRRIGELQNNIRDLERRLREMGVVPSYARGGIARGSEAGHLALLHGDEAVIPLDGMKVPVELRRSTEANLNQIRSIQDNMASKMPEIKQLESLPDSIRVAIENSIQPVGLLQGLDQLKNQFAEGNKSQLDLLQKHLEKLESLASTAQDHVRVSERIANDMA